MDLAQKRRLDMKIGAEQIRLSSSLPPALSDRLSSMIRRARRVMVVRGITATVAVALLSAMAIMAVDAMFPLDSARARWSLFALALAGTLAAAWRVWARPLARPLTPMRMARVLEHRHPGLQERISSAIELLGERDGKERWSNQLIALLEQAAEADMGRFSPKREFTTRTLKPWRNALLSAVALLIALFALWPRQTGLLLARAVAPYADMGNVQAQDMHVFPGHITALQGDDIRIALSVPDPQHRRHAWLRRERPQGGETVERMRRIAEDEDGDGRHFDLVFPRVQESFRYRIGYGAGLTRFFQVDVLPPLASETVRLTYRYPDYTGLDTRTVSVNDSIPEIAAVRGSHVEIVAAFGRPVHASIRLGEFGRPVPATIDRSDHGARQSGRQVHDLSSRAHWLIPLTKDMPERWSFQLTDGYGFTNKPVWAPLRVDQDRAPEIVLTLPATVRVSLDPRTRMRLHYAIREDFGVAAVELWVAVKPDAFERVAVLNKAERSEGERWHGSDTVRIREWLPQPDISIVWMQLRVVDNLPAGLGGPQSGQSRVLELELVEDAQTLMRQELERQAASVRETIEEAAKRLEKAAGAMRTVGVDLSKTKSDWTLQTRRLHDEARNNASAADALLEQLEIVLPQTAFRELLPRLTRTRKAYVVSAVQAVEKVALVDPAHRGGHVKESIGKLDQAAAETRRLLVFLETLVEKASAVAALDELAERQWELADRIKDNTEQAETSAEWREEQKKLASELAEWEKAQIESALRQFEETSKEAAELAAAARDWTKKQETLRETAAELADPETNDAAKKKLDAIWQERMGDKDKPEKAEDTAKALQEQAAAQARALTEQAAKLSETLPYEALKPAADKAAESMQSAAQHAAEAGAQEPSAAEPSQRKAEEEMVGGAEHLDQVAQKAEDIARRLEEMLNPQRPRTPEQAAEALAQNAQEWAQKQETLQQAAADLADPAKTQAAEQKLSELWDNMAPEDRPQPAAPADQAQQLQQMAAERAQALAEQAQAMSEAMQKTPHETLPQMAAEAAQAVQSATEHAAEAAGAPPGEAAPMQQKAQEQMQQGAEQMRKMANELAAHLPGAPEAPGLPDPQMAAELAPQAPGLPGPPTPSGPLAPPGAPPSVQEALNAMLAAMDAPMSAQAAALAEQAAQAMQATSMQAAMDAGMPMFGDQPGPPGPPGFPVPGEAGEGESAEGAKPVGDHGGFPPEWKAAGFAVDEWVKLRGKVDASLVEENLRGVPPEYRELVRRYFLEIGRQGRED
jgi:hypothetical protein